MLESEATKGGTVLQRTCYIPSPFGNLLLKTAIGADRPSQSCNYTLGAAFVIISQNFLIVRHKSFGRVTIAHHNIEHVLWRAIAASVAFYSRPGLVSVSCSRNIFHS